MRNLRDPECCNCGRTPDVLKRSSFIVMTLLLGLALLAGCSGRHEPPSDFDVLFNVNGVERTVYDFESSYVEHLLSTGRSDTKSERNAHLNKMIDEILLASSAANKGLTDHPTYQSALQHEERKSMIDTYFVDRMEEEIPPLTDEEVRLAYAKRLRKVYIRQLYAKDPAELEEAYRELEDGESFVDVANRFYQTSTYDSLAGYLGPVSYFGIDDVVAEAAYGTNEGEYTKPVRSRLGHHILYVEYIEFPGLLTEDDYQYRRQGVKSQLRLRRQRMISNDYIFELMSRLNVETNNPNILKLRDVIEQLDGEGILQEVMEGDASETVWKDDRVASLASSFDPSAELASYIRDGIRRSFTFGDYIQWLPYLSFQESKVRLGASIGRGLRNQVLYEFASEKNYAADERVQKKLQKRGTEILSELHQYELTVAALRDTAAVEVPESFHARLVSGRDVEIRAGYWKIPVKDLKEAQEIKEKLVHGSEGDEGDSYVDPSGFEGYVEIEFGPLDPGQADYDLVRKSIPGVPVVGYSTEDGWLILQVNARDMEEKGTTTNVADIEQTYKVYDAIQSEIDSLRGVADIHIETELFNDIYDVWSPGR